MFSTATALADAAKRRRSVETAQTYTRRRRSISTRSGRVSTTSRTVSTSDVSTASELGSTAGVKEKDKGKAIMQESEPLKKVKKRVQVQMSMDEELAKKVYKEEQAKAMAEQEQERINFEAALELQKYLSKEEHGHVLEESGRLQDELFQGNEILEKKDSEKKGSRKKSLARKKASEKQSDESTKTQKIEDDVEKEELKAYLDLVPREEFAMEIESLATKSSKNYKIFGEMLDDFDRQDVLDLHRLVKARYMTSSPEGYDLMLWGDLKILFEPDEEDEVWRNQHEYNLISWRLFDSCGIHILLMNNGISIHMMIEKKYPLTQEMLSKMLSRKLEVDHENEMAFELLRFIRSQVQK
ncbi:hypothetical protein Tco_0087105 [Tanacetum coccineum]